MRQKIKVSMFVIFLLSARGAMGAAAGHVSREQYHTMEVKGSEQVFNQNLALFLGYLIGAIKSNDTSRFNIWIKNLQEGAFPHALSVYLTAYQVNGYTVAGYIEHLNALRNKKLFIKFVEGVENVNMDTGTSNIEIENKIGSDVCAENLRNFNSSLSKLGVMPEIPPRPQRVRPCSKKNLVLLNENVINAASQGDADNVASLLDAKANINAIGGIKSRTVLMHAVDAGRQEVVALLLDRKADTARVDSDERSALTIAAMRGYVVLAKQLLRQSSCVVDRKDNLGRTPLMWAAYNGHIPVMRELVRHKAQVEARDFQGYTALDLADRSGKITQEMEELLLVRTAYDIG